MKRISFWPRKAILSMGPPANSLLISVFDRKSGPLPAHHPDWGEVLELRFHDNLEGTLGLELFQESQAKQVFDLLARHPNCDEVVVHCDHGSSRSAAIALYLAGAHNVPCYEGAALVSTNYPFANRLVLQRMASADPGPQ